MPSKVRSASAPVLPPAGTAPREVRGSAHSRGYGRRWEKLRKLILHRDPLCVIRANVVSYLNSHRDEFGSSLTADLIPYIARLCHGENPSRQVDHKVPKPEGKDTLENLQGGCDGCHSLKTWIDEVCAKRGRGCFFHQLPPARTQRWAVRV